MVHSVKNTSPMKDAFNLLTEHCISGVAVIDEHGSLVGNVSASDIKIIGPNATEYGQLLLPIKDLLPSSQAKSKPIIVNLNHTVADVIKILSVEKIHRVFIIEKNDKLLGVISPVNLLELFLDYA